MDSVVVGKEDTTSNVPIDTGLGEKLATPIATPATKPTGETIGGAPEYVNEGTRPNGLPMPLAVPVA